MLSPAPLRHGEGMSSFSSERYHIGAKARGQHDWGITAVQRKHQYSNTTTLVINGALGNFTMDKFEDTDLLIW